MQRLIEQTSDEGDVLEGRKPLGRVHYHLSVYQHFTEAGDSAMVGAVEVEGYISPLDVLNLTPQQHLRTELTLRLADGRSLDFLIVNAEGTIRSTGRGLHGP
jgi:hypothetical protein